MTDLAYRSNCASHVATVAYAAHAQFVGPDWKCEFRSAAATTMAPMVTPAQRPRAA